ncbi:MAG: hypothetical protein HYV60_06575, partial [Planctomycetia bacterium]|nr:hypothetical protein [Planctomycetia bacterium]
RAAQRRAQQQQPRPQAQPPQAQRPKPAPSRPVEILHAEVIDDIEIIDEPHVSRGSSVEEHVKEHIRAGVFDEHISHLGEDVDKSDDRMEAHLHEYFEHDLGALGARTAAAADSTLDDDSPATKRKPEKPPNFLELLQNPASVRQAIILSEILTRPSDRW